MKMTVLLMLAATMFCGAAEEKAQWVNIGSNTGLFGFDWSSAGVRGLNLAGSPQSMRRGFAKVKAHRAEIADGAWIVIPMCPFTSVVPLKYDRRPSGTTHPLLAFDGVPDAAALGGFRDMLDRGWKGEFAIRDYADEMSSVNRESYRINVGKFREFFAWCRSEKLRPVVVNPPASRCFDGLFPASFMKAYVYDFIAEVKPADVPFIDYWNADELRADRNFANALFMNRTGRTLFTKRVMADVQKTPNI